MADFTQSQIGGAGVPTIDVPIAASSGGEGVGSALSTAAQLVSIFGNKQRASASNAAALSKAEAQSKEDQAVAEFSAYATHLQDLGSTNAITQDKLDNLMRSKFRTIVSKTPGATPQLNTILTGPMTELDNAITKQQAKLEALLQPYGIAIDDENVHLVKGQPAESINRIAKRNDNDIIVMGTVDRVGIPGLFIGNTAEEIFQTTACSVLAVKPDGFVSPVELS